MTVIAVAWAASARRARCYSFTASTPAVGTLRPLRDPDAAELDEDGSGEESAPVFAYERLTV